MASKTACSGPDLEGLARWNLSTRGQAHQPGRSMVADKKRWAQSNIQGSLLISARNEVAYIAPLSGSLPRVDSIVSLGSFISIFCFLHLVKLSPRDVFKRVLLALNPSTHRRTVTTRERLSFHLSSTGPSFFGFRTDAVAAHAPPALPPRSADTNHLPCMPRLVMSSSFRLAVTCHTHAFGELTST